MGPLWNILFWEVFDYLVLLVPISNSFGVQPIKRVDHLTHIILIARLSSIVETGPCVHRNIWLGQEVLLRAQDLAHVLLQIFPKAWRYLIQAANECIAKGTIPSASLVLLLAWAWGKHALLNVVIEIKAIDAASDASLASVKCLNGEIEKIAGKFSRRRNWVEGGELDRFHRLDIVVRGQLLVHLLLNGRPKNLRKRLLLPRHGGCILLYARLCRVGA